MVPRVRPCSRLLARPYIKHIKNNNNNNFISRGIHIWHECQSNVCSSVTKVCTEQVRSLYTEHAVASGLPNPTHFSHLEGEVRFIQAQDQQVTTRNPRIVTDCLLTHSMLIKNLQSISCRSYIIYPMYLMILSIQ